jgi:hypothetical protein
MSYPIQLQIIELTDEIVVDEPIIESKESNPIDMLHLPTLIPDGRNMIMIGPERPTIEMNRQCFPDLRFTYISNEEVPEILSRIIQSDLPANPIEQMVWLGLLLLSQYGGIFSLTTMQFRTPQISGLVTNGDKMSIIMMTMKGLPRHVCPFLCYAPVPHPFFRQYLEDMRKENISVINPYANTLQWFLQRRGMCQIMECPGPEYLPFTM